MRSLLHAAGEGVRIQSHTYSGHLSGSEGSVEHKATPGIHFLLPLREVSRDDFRDVVFQFGWSFTNCPEEPPLSVKLWGELGQRPVLLRESFDDLVVVTGSLKRRGGDTSLVAELGPAVNELFSAVGSFANLLKVLFNHVNVVLVVLVVDSRIPAHENAEPVETVCHLGALGLPSFSPFEVELEVDDWYFLIGDLLDLLHFVLLFTLYSDLAAARRFHIKIRMLRV